MNTLPEVHATTVVAIKHNGAIAIGADGQASIGNTIAKGNVKKLRSFQEGKIVTGFAGATADAFALLDRFEEKLNNYAGNVKRAAIELAKDWRTDRYLRRLEAMMIVASQDTLLIVAGSGDVLEPENGIAAIGSGGVYAQSAAIALQKHAPQLSALDMVRESLTVAANTCVFTNHNFTLQEVSA